ncbi:MAG: hypothetical protein EXR78_02460 [Deltaproteobacteria bacterium]|nr:hypothetical protein [Deltaproteobacteria bacterium]
MLNSNKITTGVAAGALLAILGSGCTPAQPQDTWTAAAQSASTSASRSDEAAKRSEAAAARVESAAKRTEDAAARIEAMVGHSMRK